MSGATSLALGATRVPLVVAPSTNNNRNGDDQFTKNELSNEDKFIKEDSVVRKNQKVANTEINSQRQQQSKMINTFQPIKSADNCPALGQAKSQRQAASAISTPIKMNNDSNQFHQEEFNRMRERLFRLLSKVPIQVDTGKHQVSSLDPQPSTSINSSNSSNSKQIDDRQPLIIKYYNERSLGDILNLHFSCSLIGLQHNQPHDRMATRTSIGSSCDANIGPQLDHIAPARRVNGHDSRTLAICSRQSCTIDSHDQRVVFGQDYDPVSGWRPHDHQSALEANGSPINSSSFQSWRIIQSRGSDKSPSINKDSSTASVSHQQIEPATKITALSAKDRIYGGEQLMAATTTSSSSSKRRPASGSLGPGARGGRQKRPMRGQQTLMAGKTVALSHRRRQQLQRSDSSGSACSSPSSSGNNGLAAQVNQPHCAQYLQTSTTAHYYHEPPIMPALQIDYTDTNESKYNQTDTMANGFHVICNSFISDNRHQQVNQGPLMPPAPINFEPMTPTCELHYDQSTSGQQYADATVHLYPPVDGCVEHQNQHGGNQYGTVQLNDSIAIADHADHSTNHQSIHYYATHLSHSHNQEQSQQTLTNGNGYVAHHLQIGFSDCVPLGRNGGSEVAAATYWQCGGDMQTAVSQDQQQPMIEQNGVGIGGFYAAAPNADYVLYTNRHPNQQPQNDGSSILMNVQELRVQAPDSSLLNGIHGNEHGATHLTLHSHQQPHHSSSAAPSII